MPSPQRFVLTIALQKIIRALRMRSPSGTDMFVPSIESVASAVKYVGPVFLRFRVPWCLEY